MLGNAPAHKLFDCIAVGRNGQADSPARQFADYVVELDRSCVPEGVTVEEMI